jgi:hypothetical protein
MLRTARGGAGQRGKRSPPMSCLPGSAAFAAFAAFATGRSAASNWIRRATSVGRASWPAIDDGKRPPRPVAGWTGHRLEQPTSTTMKSLGRQRPLRCSALPPAGARAAGSSARELRRIVPAGASPAAWPAQPLDWQPVPAVHSSNVSCTGRVIAAGTSSRPNVTERIEGYPRFVRCRDLLAASYHRRLDAFAESGSAA